MRAETLNLAKEFIKKWEGLSLKAYYCPAGYLTIGWGHLVKLGEPLSIDIETAERYLEEELNSVYKKAVRLIYPEILPILSDYQLTAIISFIFNLGSGAFQASTLRAKLNRGEDKEDVGNEFLRWCYAKGKFLKGLYNRRKEERRLFVYG